MRKAVFTSMALLFAATTISAQNIKGRILSSSDHQPMEFANIQAISLPDSTFLEGTTSAQDGTFILKQQIQKDVLLKVSSIGFVTKVVPSDSPLEAIMMDEDGNMLSETVITAQKALVKVEADRTTYDVSNDEDAKTNTIMEMLRKVPYVSVDASGNITIKGSSNIKIYENGRLNNSYTNNPKSILTAIPASLVDHFEVITEPGARYDGEGVDGILNIVMKREAVVSGIAGQVAATYQSAQAIGSLYLTTKIKNVNLAVNYNGVRVTKRNSAVTQDNEWEYRDSGSKLSTHINQSNPGWAHVMSMESSWQIDSLNLLAASMSGFAYNVDIFGNGAINLSDRNGNLIYRYNDNYDNSNQKYYDINGKVDFQHLSRKHQGEVLTLSYLLSTSDTHYQIGERFSDIQGAGIGYSEYFRDNDGLFIEHTFQADWEKPLTKGHSINMGAKYIRRDNSSKAELFYDDVRGSWSDFKHITDIGALYGEYAYTTSVFSIKGGLRWELSHLKADFKDGSQEDFSKNLNDLIPFASATLRLGSQHSLSLSYSSRIERPGISYLNPFHEETILDIREGNPNLKSARPQNMNLGYNFISQRVQIGINLTGNIVNNGITSIMRSENDRMYQSYGNIAKRRQYSLGGYIRFMPLQGTDVTLNLFGFNSEYSNKSLGLKNRHNGWYGSMNLSQALPLGMHLTAYVARQDDPSSQLYAKTNPYYMWNLALQRSFLKEGRLTIKVEADNLFLSKHLHYVQKMRQGDMIGKINMLQRQKYLGFDITYRFGKMTSSVKRTSKTIQNEDLVGNK